MPKIKTQAAVMRQKYELNKRDILTMTFTSEEAYATLQFNTAIAWIRANIWPDEDLVSAMIEQKAFWLWWVNQWNIRDDEFLTDHIEYALYKGCNEFLPTDELKQEWLLTHDVRNIQIQATDSVMQAAYETMISTAIKTQVK